MSAFFDLFVANSRRPDLLGDPLWADREFPVIVANSPFRLWHPGDTVPPQGVRFLVGVATWSGYDMRLLDVIAEGLARNGTSAPAVELFNTADCHDQQAFSDYIPNAPPVFQTPVAGIWRDGRLEWSGQGYEARDHLARLFGSNSDEVVKYVADWINAQRRPRAG